jgi:hypothetical protein
VDNTEGRDRLRQGDDGSPNVAPVVPGISVTSLQHDEKTREWINPYIYIPPSYIIT